MFNKYFNWVFCIHISFILLIKITKSFELSTLKAIFFNNNKIIDSSSNKANKIVENLSKLKNISYDKAFFS